MQSHPNIGATTAQLANREQRIRARVAELRRDPEAVAFGSLRRETEEEIEAADRRAAGHMRVVWCRR